MSEHKPPHSKILESEDDRCVCDFSSLSQPEIEVFGIYPHLRDELAEAYWRYEELIGCIVDNQARAEEDRARFPQFLKTNEKGVTIINHDDAAVFMSQAGGLPLEQCFRWVLKVRALEHRRGLMVPVDQESSSANRD